jgi:Phospholipase_D-nuclease N-terminal
MFAILGLGGMELMFILGILAVTIIPQIIAIVNLVQSSLESNMKIVWALVIIFVPFGWLVYFLVGKSTRT